MYTEDMTRCADIVLQEWLLFVAAGVCLLGGTPEDIACAYSAAFNSSADRKVPGMSCGADQMRHFLEDFSLRDRKRVDSQFLAQKYFPRAKIKASGHEPEARTAATLKQISRGMEVLNRLSEEDALCRLDFLKEGADGSATA